MKVFSLVIDFGEFASSGYMTRFFRFPGIDFDNEHFRPWEEEE